MTPLPSFQRLPRWLRRHKLLRLCVAALGDGPVQLVRVNNRFDAFIDTRDGFARLVAIEDEFEPEFFDLAMHLLPVESPVFVDVGANFGLLSLGLWHLTGGRLKARLYEPNPHLCTIIDRSIALNKAESLELVRGAAMAAAGQMSLHFSLAHTGGGYVGNEGGGVAVNAVVLDRDLAESNVKQVDLMKIDVEGNEGEVLAGLDESLAARRIRAIYFEYCPAHIRRSKARFDPVETLLAAGYEVFAWNPGKEAEFGPATHRLDSQTGSGAERIPLVKLTAPPEIRTADLLALPPGRAFPIR